MREIQITLLMCFAACLMSGGCKNERDKPGTNASLPPALPAISVPRGISGLELGMTPDQIRQPFRVKAGEDPVAALLNKYAKPDQGKAVAQEDHALQKSFFRISADSGVFPDGVKSADARAFHNIIYEIGFHYDEASVKKMGWGGVVAPYLAKYGKSSEDTGSAYIWDDGRTRLDIESSGPVINVFFTDKALEKEVNIAERERK